MTIKRLLLIASVLVCGLSSPLIGGGYPVVELTTADKSIQGRVFAHNDRVAWLLDVDGRLADVRLRDVRSFRKVASQFRGLSATKLRDELRREFGTSMEIAARGPYLVVAAPGKAGTYAELFYDVYGSFQRYFGTRGFRVPRPDFPLVAIVFPKQKEFAEYARNDGVMVTVGLMGYYHPHSNRVALFDPGRGLFSQNDGPRGTSVPARIGIAGRIEGSLRDTIVHEATHQIAFNTGLHSRVAETPQWVVEGLATVFEADGIRDGEVGGTPKQRLNRERFTHFAGIMDSAKGPQSLEDFVAGDSLFQSATLDAYAQAWALTFFLVETRSSAYTRYLKKLAARDPLASYPSAERVRDFKQAFGNDLAKLESEMLAFYEKLK